MELKDILQDYGPMLARIVGSYEADRALQQDLMQEVTLALWQALPNFRGDGSIKAYVARVAQNKCLTHVTKAAREPRRTELDERMEAGGESPEVSIEKDQKKAILLKAVRELALTQRQVVTLALEGFSHREIADMLGITENNATVRFARAKAALTVLLKGAV